MAIELRSADAFAPAELVAAFNLGFSGYLVPMQFDETALGEHVRDNDIDLTCSQVAIDGTPIGLVLIARRGQDAWVGGMGIAPSHRRQGVGEQVLVAGLDAARDRGCTTAWLEVIDGNESAIALYEKLGFVTERTVTVWRLDRVPRAWPPGERMDLPDAREWVAAHRGAREPWQRASESLDRMLGGGAPLDALAVSRDGDTVAAAVTRRRPPAVTVIQAAGVDEDAMTHLLSELAAEGPLRFSNVPDGSLAAAALERLSAQVEVRQREMRLAL